ncbi:uncharacterized protein METZ01_LOCUS298086, partial [marine metagenome]
EVYPADCPAMTALRYQHSQPTEEPQLSSPPVLETSLSNSCNHNKIR